VRGEGFLEVGVEYEVYEVRVAVVGFGDFLEEVCVDDAVAVPDGGDGVEVECSVVFFLFFCYELEVLSICADL